MTFDDITGSKKLWSVRLDGEEDNEFLKLFYDWSDVMWLRSFFKENINDLSAYFKITDINQAIKDTIEDSKRLRCVIMDISPDADLSSLQPRKKMLKHVLLTPFRQCFRSSLPPLFIFPILIFNL